MNKDYAKWKQKHYSKNYNERLGQHFVCDFIHQPWPELFYEDDDKIADEMIREWLTAHHYYVTMPRKIN